MNLHEAHQEAMYAAAEAHEEYGVDTMSRIDVFAVIAAAGAGLLFRPSGHVAGAYLPERESSAPGIVINSDHPLSLQRISGGHELGHHVFDHGAKIDYETELGTRPERDQLEPEEMLAEAFAAWFLMPPELVELIVEQLGFERPSTPRDVYQLGLRLGTSYKATCYHLPGVKLLSEAKAFAWGELELRKIKEQITSAPRPEGWRNDVWAIREGDEGQTLVLRAGDRLVFELADVTRVAELPADATVLEAGEQTLFSGMNTIEVDVPASAPAGSGALELERADGGRFRVELEIERPRLGVYLPTNIESASVRATHEVV